MKKILMIFALAALFAACETTEFDNFSTITGTVIDMSDQTPIRDANVTLSPSGISKDTDEGGHFEFVELDERQYTIGVRKSGYRYNSRSVTVIAGETSSLVIPMEKIEE